MRTEDQNSTLGFPIFADDSAAIGTGKTGLTITATLAKNGGSALDVTPSYTELGNGIYWITPIGAHRDTIGCNVWQFSASGAVIAPVFERIRVAPATIARVDTAETNVLAKLPETGRASSTDDITDVMSEIDERPTIAQFEARTLPSGSYFTTLGTNAPAGWINAAAIASNAITSAKIAANAIGASQIAADAIGASEIAADAVTKIQNGLMLAASYTAPDNAGITSIKTVTDRLDTGLVADGLVWQFTANMLELGPSGGGGGGGSGTGARTVTITVDDGTTALQNAIVRMTEGANTYTATTNVTGVCTFNLDDATYTVSITKSGYSYAGTTLLVDGTEAVTYSMTVVTVTPPDDPALCAVTIPIVNQFGAALPSEVVEIRFNEFVTGADTTALVLSPPPTLTSDDEGLVEVNLLRDGKYSVFYGQDGYKRRLDFTVPDAGSFTVGE
jgi:hypothetical protein